MENEDNPQLQHQLESRLPPFLNKIFEIVEDLETNSLISWNSNGTSIIIWDYYKFSIEVLPKHFKTSNFSSFVRQLNDYGFRKISSDQHEYANSWFQSGKKDLLNNIKRKKKQPRGSTNLQIGSTSIQESENATTETKIDAILNEQNAMKEQILKLRKNLDTMANQLAINQTKKKVVESRDHKMNAAVFLKQFMQLLTEKNEQSIDYRTKKTKLDDSGSSTQDQMVKTAVKDEENRAFWNNMMKNELNEGKGDLEAQHSKAMMVLDDIIESGMAERENLIEMAFVPDVEEDGHFELWT